MTVDLRLFIARTLCLLMAIFLLNFSIDAPYNEPVSEEAAIGNTQEVENLLALVFDICMDIEETFPDTAEADDEAGIESHDTLNLYHAASFLSFYSIKPVLCGLQLSLPSPNLKTLYPEVISPPPKA